MNERKPNGPINDVPFVLSYASDQLDGEALYPDGNAPFPTIVFAHGFGANREETRRFALPLVKQGYACFIFDFLGSGNPVSKSKGRSTLAMNLTTLEDDFTRVIGYARSQSYVDSSRLSLAGCSQGGLLGVIIAVKKRFPLASLILLYPGLTIPEQVRQGRFLGHHFKPIMPPETLKALQVRVSRNYLLQAQGVRLEDQLPRLSCPVLIIHGVLDQLVPYSRIKALSSSIPHCEFHRIVWGLHGLNSKHNTTKANDLIRAFLARKNA